MTHATLIFSFAIALLSLARPACAQDAGSASTPLIPSRVIAADAAVQPAPPVMIYIDDPQRDKAVEQWITEFTEYERWALQVGNRREPGWLTNYRQRRERPDPPAWLPDECDSLFGGDGNLVTACMLLAEWRDPEVMHARSAQILARADLEKPMHTSWWEHVHIDVLWPAMQIRESIYGVIGVHTAMSVAGRRLQVFVTPGAMLLNVPTTSGTRAWKVATNYGIGYRLFDFSLGHRPASLHVNFAKAWLLGDASDVVLGKTTDFAGFSLTFNKIR